MSKINKNNKYSKKKKSLKSGDRDQQVIENFFLAK